MKTVRCSDMKSSVRRGMLPMEPSVSKHSEPSDRVAKCPTIQLKILGQRFVGDRFCGTALFLTKSEIFLVLKRVG
jgi:hypothetical protein